MSGDLETFTRWPGNYRHVSCVYEPLNGRVCYVGQSPDSDAVILQNESAALDYLRVGRNLGKGYGPVDDPNDIAMLAIARRVQLPVLMNTARTDFKVLTTDEAPVLLNGDPYVLQPGYVQ